MSNVWSGGAVKPLLVDFARTVRPRQWYKQLVLFIPVVFALSALDPTAWVRTGLGAIAFSAVAGATYVVNDVLDVEEDRRHPTKRHRPIASGRLPVPTALAAAAVLALAGFGVAAWLTPVFLVVLGAYAGQNLVYSLWLKRFLLVDLFVVSAGFVLRAYAGIVLIDTVLSPWMFLSVFLAALMLATGKRRAELDAVARPATVRDTLGRYSPEFLDFVLFGVSTTLLISYSLYTFFVQELVMMLTIPFAFYAVFRYVHNVFERDAGRPGQLLFERPMLANFALWGAVVFFALYVYPRLPT